jgi:hypothetical protein
MALAEEAATPTELDHLSACAACAREVAAFRGLRAAGLRSGGVILDAPLTSWESLAPALRAAGVIRGGATARGALLERSRPWLAAAAALLLVAGGVVAGRLSVPAARQFNTARADLPAAGVQSNALLTSAGSPIVSVSDALQIMQRAERDYRTAAAYIASQDTTTRGDADRYRTRLAALDRVQNAVREAVRESPDDPMLNQYLLSTRSARAVTLQQLSSSLPSNVRLASW